MWKRALGVLVSFSALVLSVPTARAESKSDELIREGNELRRAHRTEEALPKFEEAYRLAPTPRTAAQVGLCKEALARWSEAEEVIGSALLAKEDPWIAKNRPLLEQALGVIKDHVGWVAVIGEPAGAEVLVAGRVRGRLPLGGPVHVDAGSVDVEVRATGFESVLRNVTVAAQAYQTVAVDLKKSAADPRKGVDVSAGDRPAPPSVVPPAPPPAAEGEHPALVAKATAQPGRDEAESPFYTRVWFWGTVGGVVVAGVVATLFLTRRASYPSSNLSEPFP